MNSWQFSLFRTSQGNRELFVVRMSRAVCQCSSPTYTLTFVRITQGDHRNSEDRWWNQTAFGCCFLKGTHLLCWSSKKRDWVLACQSYAVLRGALGRKQSWKSKPHHKLSWHRSTRHPYVHRQSCNRSLVPSLRLCQWFNGMHTQTFHTEWSTGRANTLSHTHGIILMRD